MATRKFKLELKYESIDRTEEIPLGERMITVPRCKNSLKELELAYVAVEKILGDRGGYEHGDLTTIIIAPWLSPTTILAHNHSLTLAML